MMSKTADNALDRELNTVRREQRTRSTWLVPFLVVAFAAVASLAHASPRALTPKTSFIPIGAHVVAKGSAAPFAPGERLTYDFEVMGKKAATGIMSVGNPRRWKGKSVLPLLGTVESEGFWTNVYPMDNQVLSLFDAKSGAPVRTEIRIREKKRSRDYNIHYSASRQQAHGTKKKEGKKKKNFKKRVPGHAQDMLSWFYYMRTLDLAEGREFRFKGFSGNYVYSITCRVTRVEEVWTKIGIRESYVLETDIRRHGSKKNFHKKATFWIGTDERRTPVKLAFDFRLGHVEGLLASIQRKKTATTGQAQAAILHR